jgi:hypothetical protein
MEILTLHKQNYYINLNKTGRVPTFAKAYVGQIRRAKPNDRFLTGLGTALEQIVRMFFVEPHHKIVILSGARRRFIA